MVFKLNCLPFVIQIKDLARFANPFSAIIVVPAEIPGLRLPAQTKRHRTVRSFELDACNCDLYSTAEAIVCWAKKRQRGPSSRVLDSQPVRALSRLAGMMISELRNVLRENYRE